MIEEALGIVAIEEDHDDEEEGREGHKHEGLEFAFGGECVDESDDAEAFADDVSESLKDFAEVSTDLSLYEYGDDEDFEFDDTASSSELSHADFGVEAEVLLFGAEHEFFGDGSREVSSDSLHGLCHGLSCTECAAHEFEGIGELGAHVILAFVSEHPNLEEG